jgi:hypothetical protein
VTEVQDDIVGARAEPEAAWDERDETSVGLGLGPRNEVATLRKRSTFREGDGEEENRRD